MKKTYGVIVAAVCLAVCLCGCRARFHNQKADDSLSRTVYAEMGEDFYYLSREESSSCVTRYDYLLKKNDAETISKFVHVLNSSLDGSEGKILVYVYTEIPGGVETVFSLKNYSDDTLENPDYDGFCFLFFRRPRVANDPFFDDPSIYTGIEGVRTLSIDRRMQEKAEEEGIDWYECWPELESITVSD